VANIVLDAKGQNCPLPIVRARKALKDVPPGDTLEVLTTDPGSPADFEAFCRTTGNILLESTQENGSFRFLIKHVGRT
jgi:tRNA 2-thiouridine synthesizing protein A